MNKMSSGADKKDTTSGLMKMPKYDAASPKEKPIETLKDGADSVAMVSKVNAPKHPNG